MSQQSNDSADTSGSDNNNNINNNRGLPAPGDPSQITLDVSAEGGSTAKLSSIGPLVVNVDGTVARITNWAEMTEPERETTLRMVGKRNKQRLAALKAKKEAEEGGGGDSDGK
ncbi:hypothetical protein K4F52_004382 [Lecanicillium sp. MT-2017a]|nr:hypothetical protein K4F52_004382 [Lecanicillium sp. MT-2017a]